MNAWRSSLGRAVVAAALLVAPVAPTTANAQSSGQPSLTVEPSRAKMGERVQVTVQGWPSGTVSVELCGNEARRGSADCAITAGAGGLVPYEGFATIPLGIAQPPVDCPCVIRAIGGGARATAPIEIDGAMTTPPSPSPGDEAPAAEADVVRKLEVDEVKIVDDGDWGALFGAAARRDIELVIRNTGTVTVEAPALTLAIRRGDSTPTPVRTPSLDGIEPGETVELSVPFHLPTLSMGSYRVEGRLDGGDEAVQFAATTGTVPWGLLIVGGLLAYLVLLRVVVSLILRRRRRAAERASVGGAPADDGNLELGEQLAPDMGDAPVDDVGDELAAAFARSAHARSAVPQPDAPVVDQPESPTIEAPQPVAASMRVTEPAPNGTSAAGRVELALLVGRHVHWDAFGGVTVEAILGALIDAGASPDAVQRELDRLRGASCRLDTRHIIQTAASGGLGVAATIATVSIDLVVGSSSSMVRRLLAESELSLGTAQRVAEVFGVLAEAEAAVRRLDSRGDVRISVPTLVGLIACCAALDDLGVEKASLGPLTVGTTPSGTEGRTIVPSPTPVAAELLRRHELVWRPVAGTAARCTAPGLAVLVATAVSADPGPLTISSIGYGADTHDGHPRPSLRAMLGASLPAVRSVPSTRDDVVAIKAEHSVSSVSVFDIDDAAAGAAVEPTAGGSSVGGATP